MYGNYYQTSQINWVQGIEGAKAYQLFPGSSTVLMDSENEGMFYIKSCDSVGMCNLRTFKFTEVQSTKPEYITREEFLKAMEDMKNERAIQQSAPADAAAYTAATAAF